MKEPKSQIPKAPSLFPDTKWTLVVRAGEGDGVLAQEALSDLCQAYWYPLYVMARGKGLSPQDAEDRVQGFFQFLLARNTFSAADPERGRLRAFLKTSMGNFLKQEWRAEQAQKRGGGAPHLSLDLDWAEGQLNEEMLADSDNLSARFDREWAESVLRAAFIRLESHYDKQRKRALYEDIKGCLQGDGRIEPGEVIAERHGLSSEGVRSAVFKLRGRFRDLIRGEIRETCANEADAKEEIVELCRILGT